MSHPTLTARRYIVRAAQVSRSCTPTGEDCDSARATAAKKAERAAKKERLAEEKADRATAKELKRAEKVQKQVCGAWRVL